MNEKYNDLKEYIKSLKSLAVAFSGGVDSTFLLKVAHDVLGENCIAITARSCSFPQRELNEAKAFCKKEGIKHIVIESEELSIDGFAQNPKNRCYLCKTELFTKMRKAAAELGMENIAEQLGFKVHMGQITKETKNMMFPAEEDIDEASPLEKYCGYYGVFNEKPRVLQTAKIDSIEKLRNDLIELGKAYYN